MKDVKLTVACHFLLKTNDSVNFFKVWQPDENFSFEYDDGMRATVTTENSTESRCFLLRTTEEDTGENDWITKTINVPAVPEGSQLYITRLEVSVVLDTAGLVGLANQVIACLGYISIIPTINSGIKTDSSRSIQGFFWKDQKYTKVGKESLDDIAQEEVHRYYGTLNWENTANAVNAWEEIDYYNVFCKESDDSATRTFLGTAFCNQFRVSGLDVVLSKLSKIVVEAVSKEGYISSSGSIDLSLN